MSRHLARLLGRTCLALAMFGSVSQLAAATEPGISLVATPPRLPVLPEPAPDTPPKVIKTVDPVVSFSVFNMGRVDIEFIVDAYGRVINPYVLRSSNPWLERPAIEAVLQWNFAPAVKNGLPVAAKVTQRVTFDPRNNFGHWDSHFGSYPWRAKKARNHKQLPLDLRWDEAPVPVASTFPIYPPDALQAEKKGRATIRFRINEYGIVASSEVVKATTPDFGGAALASIDAWRFKPARRKGAPCSALVTIDFKFDPVSGGDVPVSVGMKLVAHELRRNNPRLQDIAQLDRPPQALSRRVPLYPSVLRQEGKPGTAVIEYLIDKNGDAQLPHIAAASRPEFGYAAAQAVGCWLFEPPVKDGRTVIARCRVSFSFFAPPGPDSTGDTYVIIDPK